MSRPPDREEIARRALALAVFLQRATAEGWYRRDQAKGQQELSEIQQWVDKDGIAPFFTRYEAAWYGKALGSWPDGKYGEILSLLDALGVLLWAMSLLDRLPSYGEPIAWKSVMRNFAEAESVEAVAALFTPRPEREIYDEQLRTEMWLWRFRLAYAENTGLGRERSRQYLAATVPRLVARGAAIELVDDDLAINGRPFASLNSQEAGDGYLLMIERNVALLWLLGFDADWEKLRGGVVARERECSLSLPPDFDRPLTFLWPGPSRVVRRAMGLGHLLTRAYFEQLHMLEERPADREEAARGHLWSLRKIEEDGIGAELSANERDLMVRPLGLWTRQEMADVTWKTESLGCLLWALSFLPEMPGFDQPFHPRDVRENCPLGSTPDELEQRAVVRGPRQLATGDGLARLWTWRAGVAELMDLRGEKVVPKDLKKQIAGFALAAAEAGVVSRAINDDLPVGDCAYSDVPQEQKWVLRSIARERHLALAWLCGNVSDWDQGIDPPPTVA